MKSRDRRKWLEMRAETLGDIRFWQNQHHQSYALAVSSMALKRYGQAATAQRRQACAHTKMSGALRHLAEINDALGL
ncbi:hypothetical protein J2X65_003510 [Ancylobacter sp. 3268]|uniref:hypothetical protein n=1 Tax=Ancylobacter sp. 3268 TaxID=2817752 RepID=UPI002858B53A|nr:hypothetical protein [Ancylobacter sp. 3268]MDR6954142.1 hypothetical protein [Ancylobacter sp. 3268]